MTIKKNNNKNKKQTVINLTLVLIKKIKLSLKTNVCLFLINFKEEAKKKIKVTFKRKTILISNKLFKNKIFIFDLFLVKKKK